MAAMGTTPGDSSTGNDANREGVFSLGEIWSAVLSQRWLVLTVFVLCVAAAYGYTKTRIPMYRAYATIRMDPEAPKPLGEGVEHVADIKGDYWDRTEYYNTVFEMLKAKSTAALVVKSQGLSRNPGFVDNLPADELAREDYVTPEVAAAILQSRISIDKVKDSRLATISYADANPKRAARILDGILHAYIDVHHGELNEASTNALTWLDQQLEQLRGKLDKSELALHEYKKEKKILSVSADDQSEMLRTKMTQLTQALTLAETNRARIGARRSELRKIEGNDPAVLPAEELTSSGVLKTLREKYILAFEAAESLRAEGKGDSHPAVAAAVARRESAKNLLLAEVANIKASIEKDYAAITDEIDSLRTLYESAKDQALELNLLAIEYKRLERARNTNQELFDLVTAKSKETGLTSHLQPSNVRVVDRPEIPDSPFAPNKSLNLLAGAVGGLLLGLGLALGREQLDSTLRKPEMMEQAFRFPFLGILPAVKSATSKSSFKGRSRSPLYAAFPRAPATGVAAHRGELSSHYEPTGSMAEAARTVRTNLMVGRGISADTRVLLTTSAAPGDGKTTVATALAISLAQAGERVALVDCDLRRPRLHRIFERPNHSGVTSILAGTMNLSEVVHETVVPNLSFISSGVPPVNPAELLHGEGFANFLRELRTRYDRIVLDSPPLIPVADAAILATQADAAIVVARAFETKKHTARRAARVLEDVNANVIGTVLNAVDFSRGEYKYYQYYDYGRRKPTLSTFPEPNEVETRETDKS